MTLPSSTYRIQFRDGMTFDRAVGIVPYLKRLGISHLYASPIFTATSGSTHGYDVTDANEIDPAIGGREGFDRLSAALKSAGIGVLLDIVPNHMAASLENPWWRSVVELGAESPFAGYFDIDWSRRLTLPILGKPLDQAISDGELKIVAEGGALFVAYYDQNIPLHPASHGLLPEHMGTGEIAADPALLRRIVDAQPWELLYWRDAPQQLSYRRFFEVTGLVGLRVEDPDVFDASHKLVLELVRSGAVDGLRLDHIDGLADPAGYLDRLRQAVGSDTYIVAEKILAEGETLPRAWPISGTTGYEFIKSLPDVLVDQKGMDVLTAAYRDAAPQDPSFAAGVCAVKALLAGKNFAVETGNLLKLLLKVNKESSEQRLEAALVSLLVACPVYRTYGTSEGLDADDLALWKKIVETAAASDLQPDRQALGLIDRVFRGDVPAEEKEVADTFRRRFQQLTGPLTAKSVEDTMFYRYNRLLALNEVGGEPDDEAYAVANFHAAMADRAETQPHGISSTSTHDTKRGEDARARLYALSEAPDAWRDAIARWGKMNAAHVARLKDGPAPEPGVEWMIYQALAGVWPADLDPAAPVPDDLRERFFAYLEKALREAKQRTNWGEENGDYEEAVKGFAEVLLSPAGADFRADFRDTLRPFIRTGLFNGLSQTLIKLVAPGIPDIYQGAEQLDLSLVDPDNRRMPDYRRLEHDLAGPLPVWDDAALEAGIVKQHLIASGLALRQSLPSLFAEGSYMPIKVIGERARQIVAFARADGGKLVIAVAPRLIHGLAANGWPCGDFWGGTVIMLPGNGRPWTLCNALDNKTYQATNRLELARILRDHPVALLVSQP